LKTTKTLLAGLTLAGLGTITSAYADQPVAPPGTDDVIMYIVGGTPAEDGPYRFTVSLQRNGSHFCGGSYIANNWILTAAHCVPTGSTSGLSVLIGRNDLNASGGERIAVSQVIVHPSYNDRTSNNDIALLRLQSPVTVSAAKVRLANASETSQGAGEGDLVTVTGWGATREGGPGSADLLKVDVPVVSNSSCNSAYGNITSNMLCAGYTSGGRDSCQGDSGGPLVFQSQGQFYQVGVVSFGNGCARPNYPGVYTRVSQYTDWIAQYTGSTPPPPPPADNVLKNGEPQTVSGSRNQEKIFKVNVPAGADNLAIKLSGGSGDADLYVRFGSQPTTSTYDCRPYQDGNNESCSEAELGETKAGVYYVSVRGYSNFSGAQLVATYTSGGTGGDTGGDNGGATLSQQNLSGSAGYWRYYTIDVAQGSSALEVVTGEGSGDADLYVRYGARPTSSSYHCRSNQNANEEQCRFSNPPAGTWHIGIRGYRNYSGLSLEAAAN